jgi:hypothetical protein
MCVNPILKSLILRRCGYRCEGCGMREGSVIHHRDYRWSTDGLECPEQVMWLCSCCHSAVHRKWHPDEFTALEGSVFASGDTGFGMTGVWRDYLVGQ